MKKECPVNPSHTLSKNLATGEDICTVCGESVESLEKNDGLFQKGLYDPPSGWMYGFPRRVPIHIRDEEDFKKWLLDCGYPKKDLELACKYGRWIG